MYSSTIRLEVGRGVGKYIKDYSRANRTSSNGLDNVWPQTIDECSARLVYKQRNSVFNYGGEK